jgi:hypothetical protein
MPLPERENLRGSSSKRRNMKRIGRILGRRIDFSDGYIILPPNPRAGLSNLAVPSEADLWVQSSTQKYPIGTQLKLNGNIYRYSKAGENLTAKGFLKCNYTQCPGKAGNSVGAGFEGALYAAVAAGDTSFKIADTAATAHLYEGAVLVIYDDTNGFQQYRVIDNDASNGTYTTCYIASPGFKFATTTTPGITVYLNPYMNVREFSTGGGYASALGYARIAITSGYFFWLVTAGPVSCITGATTWPGQTQYNRDVFANTDGSLIAADNSTTVIMYQRVGYLLSRTASDYGDNLIMLQLDQ